MAATDVFARRATLSRSVRLLSQFRFEQTDPARFYTALAEDTAAMVGRSVAGDPSRALRPAGPCSTSAAAPATSRRPSTDAGFDYIGVEPDPAEMHAGPASGGTATYVRASGMALPFADASVDICLSSNVAEHVPEPWRLAREMLRVTRPGGLAVLSYTVWLGPFGGHEMGLTPLSRRRAAPRRATPANTAIRPKNDYGSSLFAVSAADGLNFGGGLRRAGRRIPPLPPADGRGG